MKHDIAIVFDTAVEHEDTVRALIERCALHALMQQRIPFAAQIDVTVVDADRIRALNAQHRNKNCVTDVLSFPMYAFLNGEATEPLEREPDSGRVMLGDMILCYTRACEQAADFGHSPARECGYLTVHSVLHLLGYDHERDEHDARLMRTCEESILHALDLRRDG